MTNPQHFPQWWHSTDAEPCDSGPARPDDALCEAHGRLVVKAGENGWPVPEQS